MKLFVEKYKSYKDENAELKEQCLLLANCNTCHSTCKNENAEMKEQLNKAKEIIEGLMRFCRCFAQHHTEDIRYKEAEQFLREME